MKWVTVWGNATSVAEHKVETYAKNVTLRYPLTFAFGGTRARVHLSNYCGTEPVTITEVTVAKTVSDREIDEETLTSLTFGGEKSVTIGAGEELFSDEFPIDVEQGERYTVSLYLGDFAEMRSGVIITGPLTKGFFSVGDQTHSPVLPINETRTTQTFYFLTGFDLFTSDENRAVVCYGDSITAQSWPDYLTQRFLKEQNNRTAIIRRAASGTRVLREYTCITYESYGLMGDHRFHRELSTVSGVEAVVIQQGINDIIHPVGVEVNPFRPMSDLPTVEELEEGIEKYLDDAKRMGVKAYLGTLLPIYGWRTYASFREEMKEAFNLWVRSHENLIDFDKAVRGEENVYAFKDGFDSGDHLHPSEKAYSAMADLAYEILK